MFRKLIKLTGLLLVVGFLIATVAFTTFENKNNTCSKIEVNFRSNDIIKVTESDIIRMVKAVDNQIVGKSLKQINSEEIEKEIEKLKAIEKVDVYKVLVKDSTSFKGVLSVKVKHRKPVVRVMSTKGNYYLDKKGNNFPLSINYTANVLTVTGSISEEVAVTKMLPFVLYVENDAFWKAQIQQIHVQSDGDAILTPLVGDQLIELGSFDNYEKKLKNMKAFYEQVLAKNNWDKYKTVSVKYDNQVIAKKR
jgi:cell division protein FtsQ